MVSSIIKGLSTAFRNPKLVLVLWMWNLLLGLAAAMPARAWFGGALDGATETERLLTRFSIGTFADLSKYQETGPFGLLVSTALGLGLLALAGNAFVNGGMAEVVSAPADTRPFMHRFFRGCGHFFWRFTRLNLLGFTAAAVAAGLTAAALDAATAPFTDSEWEPAALVWSLVTLTGTALVGLWFVLALDFARLRTARDGGRRMLAAYVTSLRFVARHLAPTYGIALVCLVGTAAVLLAYVGHEATWTQSSWGAIFVLLATQQVLMMARMALRVAQVGAEWAYYTDKVPPQAITVRSAEVPPGADAADDRAAEPEPADASDTGDGTRPYRTVVIGGIVTSTLLTLIVLPTLYELIEQRVEHREHHGSV